MMPINAFEEMFRQLLEAVSDSAGSRGAASIDLFDAYVESKTDL
jgi:hypothetical protein